MRNVVAILGLVALVSTLAGMKVAQISTLIGFGKQMMKAGPPPETVATGKANKQAWEETIPAVGSIVAARGVSVSNDASGIVSRILFESGASVREGQVLVELDTSVERAQLASNRARQDLARVTAARSHALLASGSISAAQLDADEAAFKSTSTDTGALQAQVGRKTVRAPFSGRLGIRLVNLGQYLTPGTPIATLEAIDTVYVDFSVPQQRLADVALGMPVRIDVEGVENAAKEGEISALDPAIDPTTRTIKLRASLLNQEQVLRPGMFATIAVVLPKKNDFVTVPDTAIVHAPYGDSVFVVEDKKDESGSPVKDAQGKPAKVARQQFVKLGETRGDFVAILDGVSDGQEVVTAGAFKLRNGSGVVVNNEVKPTPALAPHPENR